MPTTELIYIGTTPDGTEIYAGRPIDGLYARSKKGGIMWHTMNTSGKVRDDRLEDFEDMRREARK
jgi:hypothetical protein